MSAGFVGTLFIYSAGSGVRRQKLVKYSRQNMVVISRRQQERQNAIGLHYRKVVKI